jgi:hypothetical protein
MEQTLTGLHIAILVPDGFEQAEFTQSGYALLVKQPFNDGRELPAGRDEWL